MYVAYSRQRVFCGVRRAHSAAPRSGYRTKARRRYTAALCLVVSALRRQSCGEAAVRRLHQRCPQTAPPFLPRTKSCSEPLPGKKFRRFCLHETLGTCNGRWLMLPDTPAAAPRREPLCVLPCRPKSRAALRCQAAECTGPSQPTAPRYAPSRFTASTAVALLRGGCGAPVRRPAAGGGRQARAGRASSVLLLAGLCQTPCRLQLGRVAPALGCSAAGASLGAGGGPPPPPWCPRAPKGVGERPAQKSDMNRQTQRLCHAAGSRRAGRRDGGL